MAGEWHQHSKPASRIWSASRNVAASCDSVPVVVFISDPHSNAAVFHVLQRRRQRRTWDAPVSPCEEEREEGAAAQEAAEA